MHTPSTYRPATQRVRRSPNQSLSPYLVEEVAMTRSDVLRARDIEAGAGRKRK
jgi:hypothetical protein